MARSVDLRPWADLVPLNARIAGIADADLSVDEPLAPGVPNRVQGSVAVSRLAIGDGRREVIGAERVAADRSRGALAHAPVRETVVLQGPRAMIERDNAGEFPLRALFAPASPAARRPPRHRDPTADGRARRAAVIAAAPSMALAIGDVVVKDGRLAWRDDAVTPRAALDFAGIDAALRAPAGRSAVPSAQAIGAAARRGSGRVAGRVGLDPITADVRVTVTDVAIAPYQPYVPVPARSPGARISMSPS